MRDYLAKPKTQGNSDVPLESDSYAMIALTLSLTPSSGPQHAHGDIWKSAETSTSYGESPRESLERAQNEQSSLIKQLHSRAAESMYSDANFGPCKADEGWSADWPQKLLLDGLKGGFYNLETKTRPSITPLTPKYVLLCPEDAETSVLERITWALEKVHFHLIMGVYDEYIRKNLIQPNFCYKELNMDREMQVHGANCIILMIMRYHGTNAFWQQTIQAMPLPVLRDTQSVHKSHARSSTCSFCFWWHKVSKDPVVLYSDTVNHDIMLLYLWINCCFQFCYHILPCPEFKS